MGTWTPGPGATPGNDTFVGDANIDVVNGGDGNDTLSGGGGDDNLFGDDGDDVLTAAGGAAVLDGGNGDDRLFGNGSNVTVLGGDGSDTLYAANLNPSQSLTLFDGGAGQDFLGVSGNVTITGAPISLEGIRFGNGVSGNGGQVTGSWTSFSQLGPTAHIIGGVNAASQVYINDNAATGSVSIDLSGWTFDNWQSPAVIGQPSATDDTVRIILNFYNDTVIGSTQDDSISGGYGDDTISGGGGNDTITGTGGIDTFDGGAGNDALYGGEGTDVLVGGFGNDLLDGGEDIDTMTGGAGDDTYIVYGQDILVEAAGEGTDTVRTSQLTFSLAPYGAIENLSYGSGYDDFNGAGNALNNIITGSYGDDLLDGAAGNDTLIGDTGDDVLTGGLGADRMEGGLGDDIYDVDSYGDVVVEGFNGGLDAIFTDLSSYTLGSNVEGLFYIGTGNFIGIGLDSTSHTMFGGAGGDYFYTGSGSDYADGGAGIDVFVLGAGNDTAYGGDGQDYMYGGAGDDELDGEAGVDVLIGEAGNDTAFGADGGDYFYLGDGDDVAYGEAGNDIFVLTNGNDDAIGGDGQDYFYMGAGDDYMDGGAGVDVMLGEAGADTFFGGLGVDYAFLGPGGVGDNDLVVIDKTQSGVIVVNNFEAGGSNDQIGLIGTGWITLSQVKAHITDYTASGGFCVLTIDADTSVWLIGVTPAQLTSADFLYAS